MNVKTRLLLTACAGAFALGVLVVAPPTYAQDKKDDMKKDMMKSDKKDMKKDDMMKKDGMKKKDDMKK